VTSTLSAGDFVWCPIAVMVTGLVKLVLVLVLQMVVVTWERTDS
jgi:hypothetical protein